MPIVIRMEGTNVEKGKQMLKESGLNFADRGRHEGAKAARQRFVAAAEATVNGRTDR